MGKLASWNRLTWTERSLLLKLMALLPLADGLLRTCGLARSRNLIARITPTRERESANEDLREAEYLRWLVEIASRHGPLPATCLRRALVLYGLLRRRGFSPRIVIGVDREDRRLLAHAWVEVGNHSLISPHERRYRAFPSHDVRAIVE